ncbi:MAG: TonB-dependent receptor [candidate division KSB1 bacterium]|nr:TonB-dependent receptor [candidate division KSB1 bacterium]MDZ7274416.1 TonB-dependent receptor [candidate division KSB1 bacterium]MDZ7284922.1 TonB-dependent receptor [candidate division KSB1 bacterium]MDZ7297657.1 TonB-dependent receptor [candidate division KSB1 bacterium]MDZ7308610.1 TonB-dependent receptor [candidate division KSB1 bacterium]
MACLLLLCTTGMALATGMVSGKVTDKKSGEALPGANVVVKGTRFGATTDAEGNYTISNLPAGTYTLVVSYIGYRTQSFDVQVRDDQRAVANFVMREDILNLDEVVVTGISSRTAKEVAEVAVSRVATSTLTQSNAYQSVTQLVSGKVAGVNLAPSSGNAGSGYRFNVRSGGGLKGDEQPVIYIDGVRVDNSEVVGYGVGGQGLSVLASLNPSDIEKIEFLKGPAAAASYGTSGANGVVLISTKRGRLQPGEGSGLAIEYRIFGGTNRQSFEYKDSDFVSAKDANRIFRDGDVLQQTVNISGGNERLKYFTSYDDRNEQGITRNNSMNRKNVRANLDIVPNDKLVLRLSTGYTLSKIHRPNNDNNIYGYLGNTLLRPRSYLFTDSAAIEAIRDVTNSNRFLGSASVDYTPVKNLFVRGTVGIDDDNRRQDQTFLLNYRYGVAQNDQGTRRIYNRRNIQYTYTLDGRYEYQLLSKLHGTAIVGAQLLNRRLNTSFFDKFNFSTELITNIGAGANLAGGDEGFENRREAGIFTEHSFNYNDQYFFTLGLRRDYASVIGKEAPSINYPKASGAVRLDRYDFFPNLFSLMKLRLAYGETGILPDLLDGIPLLWRAEQGGYGAGAVLATIGNAAIKPERVRELELGFEAEFLEKYGVEFTYYLQRIKDSIINFRNSPSTGKIASAVPFNIGKVEGSGVELLLRASPWQSRNFGVDLTVIASHQDNEVKSLGGAQPIFDGFDINVIKDGLPKHEFYTRVVTGVTYDADGYYSGAERTTDRVALGNPVPKNNGSFSVTLRLLKNFNLYALADWATEMKMFNNTELFSRRFGNDPEFNRVATQLGIAGTTKAGGVASFATPVAGVTPLTPGTPEYRQAAERFARMDHRYNANFIEDADYIKLREVSLSYSLRDLILKSFAGNYLSDLTVGISASNLWTSTKYSGADVEINFAGARSLIRGQDFLTLMQPRSYYLFMNFSL